MAERAALLIAAVLLGGCGTGNGNSGGAHDEHFGDRVGAALGLGDRMSPPTRMRGLWIDEFEGSRFLPGATERPAGDGGPEIWLDVETNRIAGLFEMVPGEGWRVFLVDFVGRRTLRAGHYGHMGMSDHEVIVDRLISARQIEPAPAPR